MMNDKIVNVYKLKLLEGQDSFIYSLKKTNDPLGFQYYILIKNEKNEPMIYDAGNAIKILQNQGTYLIPVKKEEAQYEQFLSELLYALNQNQKESQLSKK